MTGPPLPPGNASGYAGPLSRIRICDLSGQLAGAGATRHLAAFGAQVIRVEDPVRKGAWDILREAGPRLHDDPGPEGGAGFNNHNVEKLGITLNLRTERGRELFTALVRQSNAVTENFAAGVMDRLGFGYEDLKRIREDIVYVSNSGFGHAGSYHSFKSWGPIVQALSGLTHASALPGQEPAGWGYSYMDHSGGYVMAVALLAALYHQRRTGVGQWVDIACLEAGIALAGLPALDATVNHRAERQTGVNSNRSAAPAMSPHGIYRCQGDDTWVALACRDDGDWERLAGAIGEPWAKSDAYATLASRLAVQDDIDQRITAWTAGQTRAEVTSRVRPLGIPCVAVLKPSERCDGNEENDRWGLWPTVQHATHGPLRVDGLPVHLSRTDWQLQRGGPVLGQDNDRVLGGLLGLADAEIRQLADEGVI